LLLVACFAHLASATNGCIERGADTIAGHEAAAAAAEAAAESAAV